MFTARAIASDRNDKPLLTVSATRDTPEAARSVASVLLCGQLRDRPDVSSQYAFLDVIDVT